jgi:hypothetical protein
MLHVRVVTTPGLTGRLLDRLADLPGIRNLIVLEGAARPSGDAVFFDVDHSAANPVFRALRGLSLDHDGAVTVEPGSWAWYPSPRPAPAPSSGSSFP